MPGSAEKARKGSGKLAFFLGGLALVLAVLGWVLPKVGQSLLLPATALVLVGLVFTALTAAVFARRAGWRRATGYLLGGVAVTVLAFIWTTDAVLPLRVLSVESQLNQLESCITHGGSSARCSANQESNSPLIGPIAGPNLDPVSWPTATFLQAAGRLQEFDTSATRYGPLGHGLLYDANPGDAAEIPNICLRHLYGPWYEFAEFTGDCPWGYNFAFDGAAGTGGTSLRWTSTYEELVYWTGDRSAGHVQAVNAAG